MGRLEAETSYEKDGGTPMRQPRGSQGPMAATFYRGNGASNQEIVIKEKANRRELILDPEAPGKFGR